MKTFEEFGIDLRGRSGIEVKTTCPQCSKDRKKKNYPCLSVNTEQGLWHCWHCEWSGSLGQGEEFKPIRRKVYRKPEYSTPLMLDSRAHEWLKGRGLTEEVIKRARIGSGRIYMPQVEEEVHAIQFPYFQDGEYINVKFRDFDKNFRMYSGAERVLYGLDDIGEITIIVEGEIDKLSFAAAGHWNCVSVPDGAPAVNTKDYSSKFDFLDSAKDKLDTVKKFILAVDSDAPGQKLEEELARRLGRERCYRVQWPAGCKDANEVLLKHGRQALIRAIQTAVPYPIKGLFEVFDVSDKVVHIYEHGMPRAESTGWRALDGLYSVRPGEWTVITGIPSHGKSEWLDALMVNLAMKAGWSFGVFSPENQPIEFHLRKLVKKVVGKPFDPGPIERMTRVNWMTRSIGLMKNSRLSCRKNLRSIAFWTWPRCLSSAKVSEGSS
jgi:twinkle protein